MTSALMDTKVDALVAALDEDIRHTQSTLSTACGRRPNPAPPLPDVVNRSDRTWPTSWDATSVQ